MSEPATEDRGKDFMAIWMVGGVEFGDVLPEDVADGLLVNANISDDFSESAFQRTPLDVLHFYCVQPSYWSVA